MNEEENRYPCPVCGSTTGWYPECPGSRRPNKDGKVVIMVCYPPCGNAYEMRCISDDCSWWYREPNNRSDKAEMGIAPSWLAAFLKEFEEEEQA